MTEAMCRLERFAKKIGLPLEEDGAWRAFNMRRRLRRIRFKAHGKGAFLIEAWARDHGDNDWHLDCYTHGGEGFVRELMLNARTRFEG